MFSASSMPVSAFVGIEYREDKYADIYDPLSEAGQIGGSAGNSAAGTRTLDSIYFETLFPLLEKTNAYGLSKFKELIEF